MFCIQKDKWVENFQFYDIDFVHKALSSIQTFSKVNKIGITTYKPLFPHVFLGLPPRLLLTI